MRFSDTISPVCLYDDAGVNHDGKQATALGWGNLSDGNKFFKCQIFFFLYFPVFEGIKFDWIDSGGPRADVLQKVTLEIKSQDDCKRSFGSKAPGGIVDHFICAAAPKKDSCAVNSLNEILCLLDNYQLVFICRVIAAAR